MVAHLKPMEDYEEELADDPLHTIEGTDLNDRKKLLNLMIEQQYAAPTRARPPLFG